MSSMQKRLKIMSFASILAGLGMLAFTILHFSFAGNPTAVLMFLCAALATLFDFLVGWFGIGAANRPSKAAKMLPVVIVGLLVNAAGLILFLSVQGMWWPFAVNAVIAVALAYFAQAVNKEYLR